MNLWFRFLRVLLVALFRPRLDPLGESVVGFVVSPLDLDFNGHMNNGRYLTLLDLGRVDLMFRTGLGRAFLQHKWRPMVAAATIRYRRGLPPFARFKVHTRVLGWNGQSLFMEQWFTRQGQVAARAVARGVVLGSQGQRVAPGEVARAVGYQDPSPPLPPEIIAWQEWEKSAAD